MSGYIREKKGTFRKYIKGDFRKVYKVYKSYIRGKKKGTLEKYIMVTEV